MRKVEILIGFTGYPNGKPVHFAKGEEVEVSDDFADMIVDKQLARSKPSSPAKPAAKAKD